MEKPLALITGTSRRVGIAAGVARSMARAGWNLALNYWIPYDERMPWGAQQDDINLLVTELSSLGAEVLNIPRDLELPDSATEIFQAVAKSGGVSALILAHCESVPSGLLNTDIASLDRHYAVNVRANLQLIQQFAQQVPDSGGSIIAFTSDHTVENIPYGASKGALDRIVLASARELADLKIRANVINPGPIDTGWMDRETRETLISRQPTGRFGSPKDIGEVVVFLLSQQGAWVNGQLLKVDGGFSA